MQLIMLAEHVASRLRMQGFCANLISIYVRDHRFNSATRQRPLALPTDNAREIALAAISLFEENYDFSSPIRCIGISVSKLQPDDGNLQMTLFDLNQKRVSNKNLDSAIDNLRDRYGFDAIMRAGYLNRHLKNYTISNDPGIPSSLCTLPGCHI